jgi:hypothetical protein
MLASVRKTLTVIGLYCAMHLLLTRWFGT